MIFFINNNGTIVKGFPSPVYQGSDNANNIYVVAPFARNLTATISFVLPDGIFTEPYSMAWMGEITGFSDDNGNKYYGWSFDIPNEITSKYGTVSAQIKFYIAGRVFATSATTFTVGRGVPTILPETPTDDVYEQILSLTSTLQQDLGNGFYSARAIYSWNSEYKYGVNELVYYPKDTYGVLVKSVYDNNSYPPFNEANELDEHWTVVVDFNLFSSTVTDDILNGTMVVPKAEMDENGNNIAATYATKAVTAVSLELTVDQETDILTATLKNETGDVISTAKLDRALESVVVSGEFDETTKEVILTLQNGSEVRFGIAELVKGLVVLDENGKVPASQLPLPGEGLTSIFTSSINRCAISLDDKLFIMSDITLSIGRGGVTVPANLQLPIRAGDGIALGITEDEKAFTITATGERITTTNTRYASDTPIDGVSVDENGISYTETYDVALKSDGAVVGTTEQTTRLPFIAGENIEIIAGANGTNAVINSIPPKKYAHHIFGRDYYNEMDYSAMSFTLFNDSPEVLTTPSALMDELIKVGAVYPYRIPASGFYRTRNYGINHIVTGVSTTEHHEYGLSICLCGTETKTCGSGLEVFKESYDYYDLVQEL